jgi:transposase-like protein
MKFEAYQQSGAIPYERSDNRKAHRNGTRKRTLKTRVGELSLDKPQLREIPFETKVFERYSIGHRLRTLGQKLLKDHPFCTQYNFSASLNIYRPCDPTF